MPAAAASGRWAPRPHRAGSPLPRSLVALRIAFDLDGVLADMDSALVRQAEQLFGEAIARRPADLPEETQGPAEAPAEITPPLLQLNLTGRQQRKLWRHIESLDNFWQTLEEAEAGIVQRLAAAAAERRWEIIFLTKRPSTAGTTVQLQTQRWLESKGFVLPSVFVVQGSRGRIAASLALDIVVDDRPENCLDVVVDSDARAILVWRDGERPLPLAARRLGIGVVSSVAECLDILTRVDATSANRSGVMARVRQLLGLGEGDPLSPR
jgi:hypothetical protein